MKPENERSNADSDFRKKANLVPSDIFANQPEIHENPASFL